MSPDELVPVTIIGGYLGAGKTTLVNRLLAGNHGRRLAVLVNDFGAVNIDVDLITSHDGETISLENGCVCCSIADALGDGLDRVLALDPPPDQIVIEASGVADPGKIAAYGQGWPGCRLDAVVVLADAETVRTRAKDQFVGELVTRQLQRADLVLLTKTDLVDDEQLLTVSQWVGTVAGGPVMPIRDGDADPSLVLDLAAGDIPGSDSSAPDADQLFEAVTLWADAPLDRAELEAALEGWADEIVRVKGLVLLYADDPGTSLPHVVQRVGRRWSIEEAPTPDRPVQGSGRLVLIGLPGSLDGVTLTTLAPHGLAAGH